MRNRIPAALATLVCGSLIGCSTVATLGTDPNTALNELTAVHKTRDQAIASKDVASLSKQHASDLTVTLADGTKLDRAGYEALLEKGDSSVPSRITELTQDESSYVAIVTPGLEGKGSALRETWKRTGEGWKLKKVEEISEQSAIASKKNERKRPS
ncbi:MAG TPA: nuclear transport factor 2 family protein [Thermoanaerobaculia bacterium]